LATAIAGFIAFRRPYQVTRFAQRIPPHLSLPGDGTNSLLNKTAQFIIFGTALLVYWWWIGWSKAKGLRPGDELLQQFLLGLALALPIITIHELGHAIAGLALGMRLSAFVVGPFEWRISDGRWIFRFNAAGILAGGGVTGIVPGSTGFARQNYVRMALAGTLANVLSGFVALLVAFSVRADSPWQAGGNLALFGGWSLVLGSLNLIPLRTANGYSDGAKVFQILSKGAWGDFHKTAAMVGSTLVTPLRPRDYDINAIQRAAATIRQGYYALLLRLFVSSYFLDQHLLADAGNALTEAESIYNDSASDMPAELYTAFVFGNAFICRDAASARQWWTRMECKKPTRLGVDYWRAAAALYWIEGDLANARDAMAKSEALAQCLPEAGAYEFDRYCNSLLRKAIDAGPPTRTTDIEGATEQIIG
ncbi:MAG TPA: M50 family metallopeptidase, partial [Candidatus Sulfotelmatobacter sp.]|nr:M50 family metallopeptidase [Candidatus Sulfotelmatobacter sp.]